MIDHSRLVAPLDFGLMKLRNRIVMGAMHTRLEMLEPPTERLAAFYEMKRAPAAKRDCC